MRTIFSLGPLETDGGRSIHLCFSFSPEKVASSEEGRTVLEALRKLHAKGLTRDASCEPALEAEARELGLKVAPLAEDFVALKAGLAVMFDNGRALGAATDPGLVLELIESAVDFDTDAPWQTLPPNAIIELQVAGVASAARPCEAMVLGPTGLELCISLVYQRGATAEAERLIRQGRALEARALEVMTLFLDRGPGFVTEAVEAFVAVPLAPRAVHVRRGEVVPLTREDLAVLIATLHALRDLSTGKPEGRGRSIYLPEVKVTARLRRTVESAASSAQPSLAKAGRNDPCPCGSGKKFKRCHSGAEQVAAAPQSRLEPGVSSWHAVDERLQKKLLDHALQRFGPKAMEAAARALHGDCEPSLELLVPWSVYELPLDGTRSAGALFLAEKGGALDAQERELLDAQLAARVSLLEVLEVRPEVGLRLHDLFTGESFFVNEKGATRSLVAREVLLARILHVGGEHLLAGVHRSALPPEKAEPVLEKLGGTTSFGLPPRPPPPARELVRHWDDAVTALALELASPSVMTNTDGEPVLFVELTFSVKRGGRDELVNRLVGLEHVIVDKDSASAVELTFARPGNALHKAWKSTAIGDAKVTKSSLVLSANSEARAAALRGRIEAVAGHLLTFKSRKDTAPAPARGGMTLAVDAEPRVLAGPSDPEWLRATANRNWLDQPLPGLGERTPREAIKDPGLKWKVHRLLSGLEYYEARSDQALREATRLRKELGLDELGQPVPNHDLELALGLGRKISACLLEVAEPMMASLDKVTAAKAEKVLELAVTLWNAAVQEARGSPGELAAMRGRLIRGGMDPALFDAALELRRRWHAHDLRMIGNWKVQPQDGGFRFLAEAHIDEELLRRAREAGLAPMGPAPGH